MKEETKMMTVLNGLHDVGRYVAKNGRPPFAVVTDACPVKWFVGDDLLELVGNTIGAGSLATMRKTGESVGGIPAWKPTGNVSGTTLDFEVLANSHDEAKVEYEKIAKAMIPNMHLSVFRHDGEGIGIQEFLDDWATGNQKQMAA